jgi:hypothetical protein
MKLYLDDIRVTPDNFDLRAYTAKEAIAMLKRGNVTFISLDHDLNVEGMLDIAETGTGYDVATWIEGAAADGSLKRIGWAVHSMNPSGALRIRQAMLSAEKFWTEREQ